MNYKQVLEFWFGPLQQGIADEKHQRLWFHASAEDDADIKKHFAGALPKAVAGELDHWKQTPQGRLAMIILLDQFPRHIFRGSALAFTYDAAALAVAREGIEQGDDKKLRIIARQFFYIPFQHSESPEDQQQSLQLFSQMVEDAPDETLKTLAEYCLVYARQHHDLIKLYGRFPHRNKALGRTSSKAEEQYLATGGSHFGQGSEPAAGDND